MKAVILAGGFGTRISEESAIRPKPMVDVGGHPPVVPMLCHSVKVFHADEHWAAGDAPWNW